MSDNQKIENCINLYYEGCCESDPLKIKEAFDKKKDGLLSIFITAGYPNLNDTIEVLKELEANGVDMVELGIPFSDPMADGPVIQEASEVAIANGMTLKLLF